MDERDTVNLGTTGDHDVITAVPKGEQLEEHLAEMFEHPDLPRIFLTELALRGYNVIPTERTPEMFHDESGRGRYEPKPTSLPADDYPVRVVPMTQPAGVVEALRNALTAIANSDDTDLATYAAFAERTAREALAAAPAHSEPDAEAVEALHREFGYLLDMYGRRDDETGHWANCRDLIDRLVRASEADRGAGLRETARLYSILRSLVHARESHSRSGDVHYQMLSEMPSELRAAWDAVYDALDELDEGDPAEREEAGE